MQPARLASLVGCTQPVEDCWDHRHQNCRAGHVASPRTPADLQGHQAPAMAAHGLHNSLNGARSQTILLQWRSAAEGPTYRHHSDVGDHSKTCAARQAYLPAGPSASQLHHAAACAQAINEGMRLTTLCGHVHAAVVTQYSLNGAAVL